MNNRVLFIISNRKTDVYGITSGLYNSAKFVADYLVTKGYDAKLVSVQDANSIDREVTQFNPSTVIVEAIWVTPAKFTELFSIPRHKCRRWIVRIHSKAPFLANEGPATDWIRQYTEIENGVVEIAPNTRELTHQLQSAFPKGKFTYLPNVYFMDRFVKEHRDIDPCIIDIGCFGAIRPMKNTYQQALAAIAFAELEGKKLRFHINSTRTEQGGERVLKNLRGLFSDSKHELIEHKWYDHAEFLKVAGKMDLGMQVSFSESFNIVSADFVTAGVPMVTSDEISWMPGICQTSPTSHAKMVKKLRLVYGLRWVLSSLQKLYLKAYSNLAEIVWLREIR